MIHRFGRLGSWSWRLRCTLDVALARRGLVGLVAWGVRRGARGPGAVRSRRAERRACRKRIYIYTQRVTNLSLTVTQLTGRACGFFLEETETSSVLQSVRCSVQRHIGQC